MDTESENSAGMEIPAEPDLYPQATVDALERRINAEKIRARQTGMDAPPA